MREERGGECVGGGGTEEQVVVVLMKECNREGGEDGVFLSETSLNAEHLPHSRLALDAEQKGRWRRGGGGGGGGDCGGKYVFIHVCKVDLECAMCGRMCEARAQNREHHYHHYLWF